MGAALQAIPVPSESRSQVQIPLESRPAMERKRSGGEGAGRDSPVACGPMEIHPSDVSDLLTFQEKLKKSVFLYETV